MLGAVSVLAPEQARKMAVDVLRDVSKGMDPSADRHAVRGSIRVSELCDLYLADAEHRIKPSTYKADVGRIRVHIKPLVGQLSVRGLTSVDVERFKADILNGKMAAPRKGTILEHGRRLKIISDNPVRGVRKPPDRKSTRFLSMEEITRLGATMNSSTENPVALAAIRLLLLTGMRREEVLALPKAWVDCGSHCVRLEDSKGGFSIRPLGSAAVEVIEGMMIFDSPWLFPSERNDGHYVGLPRVLQRLCAKAELQRVTIHSLRHSFASVAEVMGFTQLTVAALLGHAAPGMTSRYIHHVDAALVVAADAVSTRIAEAMNEHSPSQNMA